MRNADKQSLATGREKVVHKWDTRFCDSRTDAPLQLVCEKIKTSNPRDLRYYQIAYDIVHNRIEKEFNNRFKRR